MATMALGCPPPAAAPPLADFSKSHAFSSRPPPSLPRVSFSSISRPRAPTSRLRVCPNRGRVIRVVGCSCAMGSGEGSESSPKEATIDLQLPRRSLLVQFTCDACGARTKRLINRVAYEKGTVFLQCAGCLVYHKFVDNLGLVVEYDLHEENGVDPDAEA